MEQLLFFRDFRLIHGYLHKNINRSHSKDSVFCICIQGMALLSEYIEYDIQQKDYTSSKQSLVLL